jgi:hypothetical protein
MPITSAVSWTRLRPAAGQTNRAGYSPAEDVVAAAPAGAERLEPLGVTGGLRRALTAMMRLGWAGPRDQERARANADRLLETIRVLSAL